MALRTVRSIIHIDEEKCNGCGLCATACAEGAIQIVDGKARLVKEQYCDGLGACLGECPQGAIRIEQRVADGYDADATADHLRTLGRDPAAAYAHEYGAAPASCPGAAVKSFAPAATAVAVAQASALRQWPVQLTLVPPVAPYFQGADLLLTADCVPYAYADYHSELLAGRAVVVGCPKLDNTQAHVEKLTAILTQSEIRSLTVAIMEVPCCQGLVRVAQEALAASGKDIPLAVVTIGIRGNRK
jgi:Fe-S-cluster-containing hydrogenase component 2